MRKLISPWGWVPSLYFAEGLPNVLVMTVSVIMFKKLGVDNSDIALYTGWFYLPWVIKPFWSPFVDMFRTKRWWIVLMQFLLGGGMASLAFCIQLPAFLQVSVAVLWLLSFSSATHDIAADGYYMLALDEHEKSLYVGIRSTFYRISMIAGQGLLVMCAGFLEHKYGNIPMAWSVTLLVLAAFYLTLAIYHFFFLPHAVTDKKVKISNAFAGFFDIFASYFRKPHIVNALAFILLYRLGEAQLSKITSPFLLDAVDKGGLALSTEQVGLVYGTIGIIMLMVGGILGGVVVARDGIGKWIWPMAANMNLPNLVYVYMAMTQPSNYLVVCSCVAIEQFGYGFGFTAFMLFLIYLSEGEHQSAHYAISTGFMALGMMLPGMASGAIQMRVGYPMFFIWVCICTIPGFLLIHFLHLKKDYGKKVAV